MKLSILVAVVIRLFAIYWSVTCVLGFLSGIGIVSMMFPSNTPDVLQAAIPFIVPIVYGTMALLAWIFAGTISLRVVGQNDPKLQFNEVTAENLYTLGILGFGLYYAIGHLADTLNWIHYLILNRAGQALVNQEGGLSLYDVTSKMIPCMAGAALAILSPKIAKRLVSAGLARKVDEEAD
jgi:hypothetical protein